MISSFFLLIQLYHLLSGTVLSFISLTLAAIFSSSSTNKGIHTYCTVSQCMNGSDVQTNANANINVKNRQLYSNSNIQLFCFVLLLLLWMVTTSNDCTISLFLVCVKQANKWRRLDTIPSETDRNKQSNKHKKCR